MIDNQSPQISSHYHLNSSDLQTSLLLLLLYIYSVLQQEITMLQAGCSVLADD